MNAEQVIKEYYPDATVIKYYSDTFRDNMYRVVIRGSKFPPSYTKGGAWRRALVRIFYPPYPNNEEV